jgi:hypothetical protein
MKKIFCRYEKFHESKNKYECTCVSGLREFIKYSVVPCNSGQVKGCLLYKKRYKKDQLLEEIEKL